MINIARIIFKTEFTLLFRRSSEWLYPLIFFCMVMLIFPLALTPNTLSLQPYMGGLVWIAVLFSNLLSLQTLFLSDLEDGYLEQWLLSHYPLGWLCLIKLLPHWLMTQLPIILLLPIIGWLFQLDMVTTAWLIMSILLGTPIITMLGALCLILSSGLRQQGMMLSLLIMPLIIPVVIFGANSHSFPAILFLGGICCLSITLLPHALGLALKISVEE